MRNFALVLGMLVLAAPGDATAQIPRFTAIQADHGRNVYSERCARCHGEHLDDGEFGPALQGRAFTDRWAGRPLSELYSFTKLNMPPDAPNSLSDRDVRDTLAYLMSMNGASPGAVELTSNVDDLTAVHVPGISRSDVGPSGGLAPGVNLPAWPPRTNPLERWTSVTDGMLKTPAPAEWLTWRRAFDDSGFSPLRQITPKNVMGLKLAWSLALPAGPNEATPLMHDGTLFVHSFNDHVVALDAESGDVLWHYARPLPDGQRAVVQRNMALYGDNVYLGTSDSHVLALDARTGRVVWDQPIGDPKSWRVSGGPLAASGVVMQGVTGRAPGGAYIVGLDARTGQILWRFNTIAHPGDPGDRTWNETPLELRNGGSVWTAGSFDPDLNLAFFGPGQTYDTATLLHRTKSRGVSNDGLYLDTTLALDPRSGKLVWYFQHMPNDQWDYDWAFERQIIELPVRGVTKKVVVTSGKLGIYDALAAESGRYQFSLDMGVQTLVTSIDVKTGSKITDPKSYPNGEKFTVCPNPGGGRSWLPASYNAETKTEFVPLVESCMDMIPTEHGEHGVLSSGYRWTLRPRPDSDGKYGRLQAVNLLTRKTVWVARQRAPQTSGTLDTAGGVLFAGALDRWFSAYDDASGELLWKMRLSDVPSSAPISYEVNGSQYVAMIVGYGGAQSISFPALVPEISLPPARSSAIWVFKLP